MSTADIDQLLTRNAAYVSSGFPGHLLLAPRLGVLIVGCADPRVNPSTIFGLTQGDAAVVRNVGGRIYPDTVRTLGLLAAVGRIARGDTSAVGGAPHIVLLHHDDCGIRLLAREPGPLAAAFGIDPAELESKAVTDPRRSLQVDADLLHAHPALPAGTLVTGLHYDITTGAVTVVVPTS